MTRDITWDGFHNARDLGGLATRDGRVTRHGALIRSADLCFVTPAGWRAAQEAGVRTVIDLRNDDEVASAPPVPAGIERVRVALDGIHDTSFWGHLGYSRLNGTPLYYGPFLRHKADRCVAAVAAVARARPGGIVLHCAAGRDRTGLVCLLLLALAGVDRQAIADDYELSTERLPAYFAAMGMDDQAPRLERILTEEGTTARQALLDVLDGFDAEEYLLAAGAGKDDLAAVRARLVSPDR
jgi:protein-tyrosine phosphatase